MKKHKVILIILAFSVVASIQADHLGDSLIEIKKEFQAGKLPEECVFAVVEAMSEKGWMGAKVLSPKQQAKCCPFQSIKNSLQNLCKGY